MEYRQGERMCDFERTLSKGGKFILIKRLQQISEGDDVRNHLRIFFDADGSLSDKETHSSAICVENRSE